MDWRLLGLLPVMRASGPDVSRSALGRLLLECVWLPTTLIGPQVVWTDDDDGRLRARVTRFGSTTDITLDCDHSGRLTGVVAPRWGDPDGGPHRLVPFGGLVEDERRFGGFTLPSRLRLGWHHGSDRFAAGEFFRVTVDAAEFR